MRDDSSSSFWTNNSSLYDRHLVPMLFAPYAEDLAGRIKALGPSNILEIAAGTGILTRSLALTLPAEVAITATDLNKAMIDYARAQSVEHRVVWRQADAMRLPFGDEVFDLVASQFGVMFFPDKRASFLEAARVLKPRGQYLFAVWDDWMKMPKAPLSIASRVVAEMLGRDPASLLNPPYHDEDILRQDLAAAGFHKVDVERVTLPVVSASARQAAFATVHGSLMRTAIEAQDAKRLEEAASAVEDAFLAEFGLGAVASSSRALVVTAERA